MLVQRDMNWDYTTDVAIVGFGMAGAVVAVTARDEGANVLVLEKQPAGDHHTNSSLSYGAFLCPSDIEGAVSYMKALYQVNKDLWWTDMPVIRAWAEYSSQNKNWMERMGVKAKLKSSVGEHKDLPGAHSIHNYVTIGLGPVMMKTIYEEVRKRGVQVIYEAPADNLLTNSKGEIVGVSATHKGGGTPKEVNIRVSRAVVLACGGFEFNEQMKLNYLPVHPTYCMGSTANTGDGIRMAMEVGADLWHMNCCAGGVFAKFPDYPTTFVCELGGPGWGLRQVFGTTAKPESVGYMIVDKNGKRFVNENTFGTKVHVAYYELILFDVQRLEYPRVPSYWIFDQNRFDAGILISLAAGAAGPEQLYRWSRDNSIELEKGWIKRAETIGLLASVIGMRPEVLESTVRTYNQYSRDGKDPDFGRGPQDLVPLSKPPFYAVSLWPGGLNTQGGPRRNSKAQVLNTKGSPIPGLYSAGEMGSMFGMVYPSGGGNLSECIAFGRIAGENAAREKRSTRPA
ncbi:MAG: FAD-dependent oxidoreductase [Dehalococcoidia bacterium]|nr:FAD-dependent oxidoreductase [Dehalococcoidia bacterium]